MKKLLISIVTVLLFASAESQIIYINKYTRLNAGFLQVDTCLCGQWFTMATRVYVDNKPAGGSALTIASPLTGVSYNGNSPVTIGIDTNIIHTSAYNNDGRYSSLFPTTGIGTATGNVQGNLNGNVLQIVDANEITLSAGSGAKQLDISDADDRVMLQYNNNTGITLGLGSDQIVYKAPTHILTDGTNNYFFATPGETDISSITGAENATIGLGSNPIATIAMSPLRTSISASATLGTRQGIISDANGTLSFTNKVFDSIPYNATPTWDYSTGYDKTILLTGDASLLFTNVQDGDQGTLIVVQDITGGHALTVPDQIVTLNTSAGDTTVLGWINQNGVYYFASSVVAPSGVTSVTGTSNRITSTGGTTPVIDISASYVGQASITTHGTITSGGLGTGAVIGGVTMTLGSDATNDMYYRNSSGVLTRFSAGNNGVVITSGAGVPSVSSTIPNATQDNITRLGTVTSGSLGTGAVIRGVTMTLGSDATGDIYYRNSSGVLTRLAVGTSKQTLHGGTNPQWLDTAASASGITIGTTTITSGTNTRVLYDNSGVVGEMTTTGSGTVLALATSPVLVTPALGVATATTINGNTFTTGTYTLTGVAGKTLTFNKSITLEGTDATTMTFPTTSATIARTDAAQTFTGVQTLSSAPVFSTATATVNSVTANVMLKQVNSVSSNSATPVDGASVNIYEITASAGLTINAPSGTQHDGDELYLLVEGGGTARAITWNGIYSPSTDIPLPTTTIINKLMVCKFIYTTMASRNKYLFVGFVNNFP